MSTNEPELLCIDEKDEDLHRQVNPGWIHDGRVGSLAFRPSQKDDKRLSVDRGSKSTARESYHLFTTKLGRSSAGTWSVQKAYVLGEGLTTYADPLTEPVPNPHHALICFRAHNTGQTEKRAKNLTRRANDRGPTYDPAKDEGRTPDSESVPGSQGGPSLDA